MKSKMGEDYSGAFVSTLVILVCVVRFNIRYR